MTGISKIVLVAVIVVGAIVVFGVRGRAQNEREKAQRSKLPLSYVEEKARAARIDDPKSIRALTDEVFERSSFREAPESIRARVFRSELSYRRGTFPAVSEEDFVHALNEPFGSLRALSIAGAQEIRTTTGQVHQFRQIMKQYVPNLSHLNPGEPPSGRVSATMSPSEIAFVAIHLITQKLANRDYQESPEEWETKVVARRMKSESLAGGESGNETAKLQFGGNEAATASDVLSSVRAQLRDESSAIVQGAHAFLDRLDLQR